MIFPILYDTAQARFEAGETQSSADVLRFVIDQHPDAVSHRQALIYALFLDRASQPEADRDLTTEIDQAIKGLRELEANPVAWLDLVETQQQIDRGDTLAARKSFAKFLDGWDQEPVELMLYVEDINRYLSTH